MSITHNIGAINVVFVQAFLVLACTATGQDLDWTPVLEYISHFPSQNDTSFSRSTAFAGLVRGIRQLIRGNLLM